MNQKIESGALILPEGHVLHTNHAVVTVKKSFYKQSE
jgi:hypothetical protein